MARLELSLPGPAQLARDNQLVPGLAYDKVKALLIYLAVDADRHMTHDRHCAYYANFIVARESLLKGDQQRVALPGSMPRSRGFGIAFVQTCNAFCPADGYHRLAASWFTGQEPMLTTA
jgi:hypothetical protein